MSLCKADPSHVFDCMQRQLHAAHMPLPAPARFLPPGCSGNMSWSLHKLGLVKLQMHVGFTIKYQVVTTLTLFLPSVIAHRCFRRRSPTCCCSVTPCSATSASAASPAASLLPPPLQLKPPLLPAHHQAAACCAKSSLDPTASSAIAAVPSAYFASTPALFKSTRATAAPWPTPSFSPATYTPSSPCSAATSSRAAPRLLTAPAASALNLFG